MKKKVSVLICLLCVVFLVLGLAACDKGHKHTTCEICGLCTDTSCTGSTSEKCQGHNTGGDETGGEETGGDETGGDNTGGEETGGDDPIIGEDPIIKDGLTYQLNDESGVATIIAADSSFNGDIPSKITHSSQAKEYSVTRIEAKIGNSTITEISIPDSVTFIATDAFSDCSGLTSATIPTLAIDYIPKSNLETIVITSGSSINAGAFKDCSSLTSITIPDSVTTIGEDAFSGCIGLTSATIPTLAIDYIPKSNLKTIVITSGSSINAGAFKDCSSLTSITIPDSVTSIGEDAFSGCIGLTSATIPSLAISYIPKSNLKTIVITSGSSINAGAFSGCSGLTSITIPDSVTTIGGGAFEETVWYNNQDDGLVYAGKVAYKYKGIMPPNTEISIKEGTLGITGIAFYGCSGLTNITIPDSVTSIGESAFSDCSSLTSITIPDSVTSIGYAAFSDCSSLTSITIPDSVTSIGESAFSGCIGLASVIVEEGNTKYHSAGNCIIESETKTLILGCNSSVIPVDGSVTAIGSYAFSGCSGLTSITIPDSVTSIGSSAFSGCSGLTSITLPFVGATKDGTDNTHFGYIFGASSDSYNSRYVPASLKTVIITGGSSIGELAFYGCSSLTSITIPDSVKSIGDLAFYGCSSLTSITIPDSVTSIGRSAFSNCSSLASVIVEEGNTTYHSVNNCIIETETKTLIVGCKSSVIPSDGSVTSIGSQAFRDCRSLTSITIPDSVTSIDTYAFINCRSLTSITIPDSVTSIGSQAFDGCRSLTSIQFSGTKSQWNAISKGSNWNYNTGKYAITCSDGVINK